MTYLKRVFKDLRRGENLDGYVTIAVAVTVGILAFFDVVPITKVSSVILAVLAVLAFSIVMTRTDISDVAKMQIKPGHQFFADFPSELVQVRNSSNDIYLIGVDLGRTIETSFGAFSHNLSHGARIRILIADPAADDSAIDARCQFSKPDIADLRDGIRHSLRKLERLKTSTGGNLEVRMTRSALKFGLNFIDVTKATATLYVQLYSFRLQGESRPIFKLTVADGEWFECYQSQAEALWAEAQVYDLGGPIAQTV
jgi:hypothetical protein